MHLSGLGNKFGVKIIINAIKTIKSPDKEPAFFPLKGNYSTNLSYVGSLR